MSEVAIIDSFSYAFEQAWSNLQWWASISFGLVALATFGRKHLNLAIVIAVSLLYTLFSMFAWQNAQAMISIAVGHVEQLNALRDASELGLAGESLLQWVDRWGLFNGIVSALCFVGTLAGVLSYLWYSYRKKSPE